MNKSPEKPVELKLSASNRPWFRRFNTDGIIKGFFGSSALMSIVVLGLITLFLFKEGSGFLGQNLANLRVYRLAGLEYVDIIRKQVEGHTALTRQLSAIRLAQYNQLAKQGKTPEQITAELADFDKYASDFSDAGSDLQGLVSDLSDTASAMKEKAKVAQDMALEKEMLLQAGRKAEAEKLAVNDTDFAKEIQPLLAAGKAHNEMSIALANKLFGLILNPPALSTPALQDKMSQFQKDVAAYAATFQSTQRELASWNQMEPVPFYKALTSFAFGTQWITNSFWQDWYGILPLFVGSLAVSLLALAIAVPFGVCSAIYVNEIASAREARIIKPSIEFIAAIPSVVLGFFGIAVLGETIRKLSQVTWLNWIPGFPISERLNIFTAAALLALMAVPTIFSLSEDALNNVPRALKESSFALGATRLQTIVRVLVPASLSGIISAVLLGFGRVIGETMVVLLCAGNRIAIPDFTQGLGVMFQPVHTMTGIIAQEMGEVPRGSIHYQALFMLGIVLFFLTLLINYLAQKVVKKFSIG
jgi:phosphate transport system permease protein